MKKQSFARLHCRSLFLLFFPVILWASGPTPNHIGARATPFTAVCFSPNMTQFVAGTSDGQVLRWSLETGEMTTLKWTGIGTEVTQMAFSNNGKWLWWLSGDKLYRSNFPTITQSETPDTSLMQYLAKLVKPNNPFVTETMETGVTAFAFSPSNKYLAIGKTDGRIIVLSMDQTDYKKELFAEKASAVKALAFSRSEKRIASSASDGIILVRDINTAFVYKRLGEGHKNNPIPTALMFNLNDKYIIAGSNTKIQLWDVYEGKVKKNNTKILGIHTLKISTNGRCFFVGGNDGAYYLDLESLEPIKTFLAPSNVAFKDKGAKSMDISADGNFLLMGCLDNSVRLWHTQYDGSLLMFAIDSPFSADDYIVASAAGDYYVKDNSKKPVIGYYVQKLGQYNELLVKQVLLQIEAEKGTEKVEEQINRAGKDYALFFAIGDYQDWGKLKNPVVDAEAIATQLLDRYGFQTELVVNPTRDQIYTKLEKYRSITYADDGQLFVFFSGHGEFVEATGEGFIISKEGLKSEKDPFQNSYIPHARLEKMLDAIPCRHVLIALDACYSGTFDQEIAELKGAENFKRPGADSKSAIVQRELEAQSRMYLTSGGKERTPDGMVHSPFAEKMLDALETEGGDDGILTINELYGFLEKAAPKPRKGRFGKHDPNGTFLFVKQSKID